MCVIYTQPTNSELFSFPNLKCSLFHVIQSWFNHYANNNNNNEQRLRSANKFAFNFSFKFQPSCFACLAQIRFFRLVDCLLWVSQFRIDHNLRWTTLRNEASLWKKRYIARKGNKKFKFKSTSFTTTNQQVFWAISEKRFAYRTGG